MSGAGPDAALSVEALVAGYGESTVVHGVDLEVARGEVVALLGPNGAGKTTLLRSIAGFHPPAAGRVVLGGRPAEARPHRRARQGIAFVGEDRHVLRGLTVRQSLRLVPGSERAVAEMFPRLAPLGARRCELLSGGEQQMLALGRALAREPAVLVVDELSLGLAPTVRDVLLRLLRTVADAGGAALVVEQSAAAILAVADRAYVMRRGRIVEQGPASTWLADDSRLRQIYLS